MFREMVCLAAIGGLTLGICGAEEKAVAEAKAIQPRAEGAVWRYRTGDYVDGKVTDIAAAHEKVVEVKVIKGVTCYRIEQGWDMRTPVQRLTGMGQDLKGESY